MRIDSVKRANLGRALIVLGAILSLLPFVSSGIALLLGIAIALLVGNPLLARTRKLTKPMLAWSIVGLGAGVNLSTVWKAGSSGFLMTLVSLSLILVLGTLLGRWLKTSRETSALITVGTAICGGSAIAAVSSVIRAKDDSISVSLGVVFILNALALFIFPPLGHAFGLTQDQFGIWAALAIHDTSSVVGASLQYGERALEIGTTVKLVRALWIIPVAILYAKFFAPEKETDGKTEVPKQYPWFIAGFVVMSALVTFIPSLQPVGHNLEWLAKRTLVLTLFLIGSGLTLSTIKNVGPKTFVQGVVLWIIVATASLAFVKLAALA